MKWSLVWVSLMFFLGAGLWVTVNDSWIYRLYEVERNPEDFLGKVENQNGDVRKRNSGDLIWIPIEKGDSLHLNDVLYTGQNSSAQIEFNGGLTLKVSSESTLLLTRQEGLPQVDLSEGEISVESMGFDGSGVFVASEGQPEPLKIGAHAVGVKLSKANLDNPQVSQKYAVKVKSASTDPTTDPAAPGAVKNPTESHLKSMIAKPKISAKAEAAVESESEMALRGKVQTFLIIYFSILGLVASFAAFFNFLKPKGQRYKVFKPLKHRPK